MPYSFQYVPTSGDLSGISFEKQTEKAINEIGVLTDQAIDTSSEAIGIATGAVTTANNALATAESANSTAQAANSTANNALSVASGIDAKAETAIAMANNSLLVTSGIEAKADDALQRADDAYDLAHAAQTSADGAQTRADEAYQQALNAGDVADMATGIFKTNNDVLNADDLFAQSEKLFVTSASATNFPVAAPLYFSLVVSESGESATQFAWSAANPGSIHTRLASITFSEDPDVEPVIAWSDWKEIGGGSGIPSGIISMWSGPVVDIPTGWALCNGQGGTPDLRNRFILGAGSTYAPGATGGSLATNTGATTLTVAQMPAHSHNVYAIWADDGDTRTCRLSNYTPIDRPSGLTTSAGGGGSHTHTLTVPPYYALCYIMKL